MNLKNLGEDYSYIIFSYGTEYFIPGERETAFTDEFNDLSKDGYIQYNFSLGSGWLFDQEGIDAIKKLFEEQQVPYIECLLSKIRTYNP